MSESVGELSEFALIMVFLGTTWVVFHVIHSECVRICCSSNVAWLNQLLFHFILATIYIAYGMNCRTTGLISMIIIILSRHFNAVVEVDYVEA